MYTYRPNPVLPISITNVIEFLVGGGDRPGQPEPKSGLNSVFESPGAYRSRVSSATIATAARSCIVLVWVLNERSHIANSSSSRKRLENPLIARYERSKESTVSHSHDLEYMVLTPAGTPEPSLAIAASRAGAVGILNLEFARDPDAARAALSRLSAFGRGRIGISLDGEAEELLSLVLTQPPTNLGMIVLTSSGPEQLGRRVEAIHASGRQVYVVVTSLEEAEAAETAGVDALIAKGNEAGGWVGEETAFVLLQRLIPRCHLPIWVQGGIGLHTAAACAVAGAAGVVIDNQLLLARESPLPERAKARISALDGSETICLGATLGASFRAYTRPNLPPMEELRHFESSGKTGDQSPGALRQSWREAVLERVGWDHPEESILAIGQDAAFAADLARRFGTVGGILTGLRQSVQDQYARAGRGDLLVEGAPLAQSHGTRYPIVQGPMTRVSDRAEFAAAVAGAGALPFLALALLRAPELQGLLEETRQLLGDRPWGVGILGFVPPELRAEQFDVIRSFRPPFALIAGGRPDQARVLEDDGILTYLHVPSPGLLQMYLKDGAHRFVFEGRECGGHVGPRTSFVLWDTMIRVLLAELPAGASGGEYHVLFAGGIHDGLSAAMVSAMAAPLAERGIRVGVLLGTAYLFTEEAVQSRAITPGFQQAALTCDQTVLLETGPGHATRCAPSPFAGDFAREKRRLTRDRLPAAEVRDHLEALNLGRLRIASKGLDRDPRFGQDPTAPKLSPVSAEDQWLRGMYMIGQAAALSDRTCTIAELHAEVSNGSTVYLNALPTRSPAIDIPTPEPAAVAIVGIGSILPGAPDLSTFWANILNKVDAITEVPIDRWDWRQYYDPDRARRDKIYSRWGGFIDDVPFDPVSYGMPPNSLHSIEPFQLLGLAVVRAALQDAGYLDRPFPRERTSVILGAGGGGADLSGNYVVRSSLPSLFGESATNLVEQLNGVLPEWTEDSFAGILMNVAAGRIANRFDFGGVNYTVDAACASSLAAVYLAVRDLESHTSDVAIVGGVDAIQNPFAYLCFSKTQALSPSGRCRPFDAQSDGIAISEGFAALVLKRLSDAERDGDRIYAVIRGAGGASDGRDRSLTAPRPEGQIRALERAYAQAGFSPDSVSLIEAHGTGTIAGDQAEIQALSTFFGRSGAAPQRCAVGSVKSMIGHTKAAAGVAGLIKVALALHHRVLPPTLGVTQPNPKANFPASPFYVNTEARPWIRGVADYPRRAGVSAFGFGGTDFHIAVEEYTGNFRPEPVTVVDPWPAELLLWRHGSRNEILDAVTRLVEKLEHGAQPHLADLAYTLALQASEAQNGLPTLAIVAGSRSELIDKLRTARTLLQGDTAREHHPNGIHYADEPLAAAGKVAFLFPGQGSQYVNMARDLAVAFPEIRACFDQADRILADTFEQPLSRYIFPPPVFSPEDEARQRSELTETNIAQPALGATGLALFRLLSSLGVKPEMAAGHSYGEFVALCAAGCVSEETLLRLSEARGRFMRESAGEDSGTMAAVDASPEDLQPLLANPELTLANLNAPRQTVISGSQASIERAVAWCTEQGIRVHSLPVACAFHSPLVAPAQRRLADLLGQTPFERPRIPVFSNTTAEAYPEDARAIAGLLGEHMIRPVEFVREIEAMYQAGARVFVEVGPRSVLSGLTSRILGDQPYLGVSLDQPGRPGLVQLLHSLAALATEGVPLRAERLYSGRRVRKLALAALEKETGQVASTPTTWLVNGGRARPANGHATAESPRVPLQVAVMNGAANPDAGPSDENRAADHGTAAPLVSTGNGRPVAEAWPVTAPPTAGANDGQVAAGQPPLLQPATPPISGQQVGHLAQTHQTGMPSGNADSPRERSGRMGASNGAHDGRAPTARPPEYPAPTSALTPALTPSFTPSGGRADDAISQFQQVMQHFLETQKAVMLAYLGSRGVPATSTDWHGSRSTASAAIEQPSARTDSLGPAYSPPRAESIPAPSQPAPSQESNGSNPLAGNGAGAPAPSTQEPTTSNPSPVTAVPTDKPALQPSSPSSAGAPPTRKQITDQLLAVVSERTGYPTEMLALDADLEADLGIDSIKRVEVSGTILRALPLPAGTSPNIEQLTASRTLSQVVDTLERLFATEANETAHSAASNTAPRKDDGRPFEDTPADAGIGRFLLQATPAPPISGRAGLPAGSAVVIVDDETGVGKQLAARLVQRGHRTVRIVSEAAPAGEPGVIAADLSHPEAMAGIVDRLHADVGPVSALVHLAALRPGAGEIGLDSDRWRTRLDIDLTALFRLAQALRPDLEQAAGSGGSAVLAATALGGAFASDHPSVPYFPGHGGITGFLKTLAQEWPSIRVKSIDIAPAQPASVTDWLEAELFCADGMVEIGYRDRQRTRLELLPAPRSAGLGIPPLDRSSVVLITGGARGITAEAALKLAEAYQPTLLLVGRTTLPAGPETALTEGVTEPQALKRALIEEHRQDGSPVTPATIETAYRHLLRERELRQNLERIRQTGARVEYLTCDVRDTATFGALVDGIYRTHGRIDGVIHGAGIIEDKLVRDKQRSSFERVLETKLNGALVLANRLRPEGLRFLVFFSSVSGRFGNRGQGDYAAASEVLNKLALHLDQQWPAHIVSINWGPWLKTGMVSPAVMQQFAERGVVLIPVEVGCRRLDEELRSGRKGEVEVLVGGTGEPQGEAGAIPEAAAPDSSPRDSGHWPGMAGWGLPLLAKTSTYSLRPDGVLDVLRLLDPAHDLYLNDHRIDGHPVFPFAMAMELMAEVATAGWPELELRALRQIRLLKGITVDRAGQLVRVTARPRSQETGGNGRSSLSLDLAITSVENSRSLYYQAVVELKSRTSGDNLEESSWSNGKPWEIDSAERFPMSVEDAYRTWLFHGPLFQGITTVEAIGPAGARATLRHSSPRVCLSNNPLGDWLIDPVVIDSALQMQLLWARLHWDVTSLPTASQGFRRIGPLRSEPRRAASSAGLIEADGIRHELRIRPESQAPLCHADHYFYGVDGRLLGVLTDVMGVGSTALNRLGGASRR